MIITGALDEWRALREWDLDYLKAVHGSTRIRIPTTENGLIVPDPATGEPASTYAEMMFANFVESHFTKARSFEATIRPGEMIYIPQNWWHFVHSEDISISVNFWWRTETDSLR